ncbi:hypothetical protein TMatcc_001510 [Talaromyces marneffei ATCC 18224]
MLFLTGSIFGADLLAIDTLYRETLQKRRLGKKTRKKKIEEVGNTGTEPGAVGVFVTRDCATVRFPPRVQKQPYVPTRLLRSSNNAKKAQAHTVIGFWAVLQSYLSYGVPPVDYEYVVTMG